MTTRPFRFMNSDSPRRPPDYGSRAVQWKLFMLVGCLFAVLWCMQQAGKPESWQWLVRLDEAAKARKAEAAANESSLLPQDEAAAPNQNYDPHEPPREIPWELEAVYWNLALQRLSPDQRFVFVEMLHHWCSQLDAPLRNDGVLESTLLRLTNLRSSFEQEVRMAAAAAVGQIETEAVFQTDESELLELTESDDQETWSPLESVGTQRPRLFELPLGISLAQAQAISDQSHWLLTYWEATDEEEHSRTVGQAGRGRERWRAIRRRFVEPFLIASISDGSRMGRSEERAAWLHLVQIVATVQNALEAQENAVALGEVGEYDLAVADSEPLLVTQQNLLGQPGAFRGKRVRVSGTIRRIERVRQSDPTVATYMHGQDYVVVWLQPGVSGQGPYCIFCLPNQELVALAQEASDPRRGAMIDGYFFKLRPYTAASGQSAVCPLLLASQVSLRNAATTELAAPPSATDWMFYVGGVIVIATVLTAGGWYATRYRSANPLGAKKRAASKVQWLEQENVKTAGQSLQELARKAPERDLKNEPNGDSPLNRENDDASA